MARLSKKKRVRPVWRRIVKRNEKQGRGYFDVLICKHAVPAPPSVRENTYRRGRSCPFCAEQVAQFASTADRWAA